MKLFSFLCRNCTPLIYTFIYQKTPSQLNSWSGRDFWGTNVVYHPFEWKRQHAELSNFRASEWNRSKNPILKNKLIEACAKKSYEEKKTEIEAFKNSVKNSDLVAKNLRKEIDIEKKVGREIKHYIQKLEHKNENLTTNYKNLKTDFPFFLAWMIILVHQVSAVSYGTRSRTPFAISALIPSWTSFLQWRGTGAGFLTDTGVASGLVKIFIGGHATLGILCRLHPLKALAAK